MNNIFKGLIAGYGAKRLGGGCLGTILINYMGTLRIFIKWVSQ